MSLFLFLFLFIALVFMARLELGSCGTNSSTMIRCVPKEREALLKFKASLRDKSGRLSSWRGEDCCSWNGVGCSSRTGHVVKLDLHTDPNFYSDSNVLLQGERLSPSLLDLQHLIYLDLSINNFSGSHIPSFLGSLRNLRYLDLSYTHFGGNIPYHLGNLSSLQYLDFSGRFYNLRVDTLGWVSNLSALKSLNLSGVNLSEARDWLYSINILPSLLELSLSYCLLQDIPLLPHLNLTSLVSLDLSDNHLSNVPHFISNISGLVNLRLDSNHLYGTIPDTWGRLASLTVLGLSWNSFNTTVPDFLFNMSTLSALDLSDNYFQGTLPTTINNLCNLWVLDISSNRFSGEFPSLGASPSGCLHNLEYLYIARNSFRGPTPDSLATLSSLVGLDVSSNLFQVNISNLGQLSKLRELDISNNSLSGTITELHFAQLSELTYLDMSSNSLVFNVSKHWVPPFQLRYIYLGSCVLGPEFPSWLRNQVNVSHLSISKTKISGSLPDWFEKIFSRVVYLDLSANNISGKIPNFEVSDDQLYGDRALIFSKNYFEGSLPPFPSDVNLFDASDNLLSGSILVEESTSANLWVLLLSNNQFNGEILIHLCQFKRIYAIDFSNNKLNGTVPDCLGDLRDLILLDLSSNKLQGSIPYSFNALRNLRYLHLRDNNFKGKLPLLHNLTSLLILDIGMNELSDSIPDGIGEKLSQLVVISLEANKLHGEIPAQLCHLQQLQVLHLARNSISGGIPPCFSNFTGMVISHQSSPFYMKPVYDSMKGINTFDSMKGMNQKYTTSLQFLASLDLSENDIVGEVPDELMFLIGLLSLNLSGNHLHGNIPKGIGNLTMLESLDLSRNNFSGSIPPSLASLYRLESLNMSYNNLSGRIPTGYQLRTLDDPSIYAGNSGLCGAPLLNACPGDEPPPTNGNEHMGEDSDGKEDSVIRRFYAGMGPGFVAGFLGFCSLLYFHNSWRVAYFKFLQSVYDNLAVRIAIWSAKLQRKFNANRNGPM